MKVGHLPFLVRLNLPLLEVGSDGSVYDLRMILGDYRREGECWWYGMTLVCEAVRGEMGMVEVDEPRWTDVDLFLLLETSLLSGRM